MNLFRYTLTFCFCAVQFLAGAQLYTFRGYNHRDGLIMESTLSTAQDGQGYLWVGTDGAGLMRFDGTHFSEAGPKGKSFQYHVSSIYACPSGAVFFSSLYDGVFKFVNNNYEFVYKPTVSDGESHCVTMVDSSLLLICNNSINIISQEGRLLRKYSTRRSGWKEVYQVLKIPQGVLIFTNGANYLVRNNRIVRLESWYGGYAKKGFKPAFGTFFRNRLVLYSRDLQSQLEMLLTNDGRIFSGRQTKPLFAGKLTGGDRLQKVCEKQSIAYLYTEKGAIFRLERGELKRIIKNYAGKLSSIFSLNIDQNNDLWISSTHGLFKVSVEPFTKVELDPMFSDNTISVIHRTKNAKIILGNMTGQLRIGHLYSGAIRTWNYRAYQVSESSQGIFIATDKGILELKDETPVPTNFPYQKGVPISLIHWDGTYLWYSPRGEGLVRYDPKTGRAKRFMKLKPGFPDHFYTAQNNFDYTSVYFGSNDGIYSYEKSTGKLGIIDAFGALGSYSGNSTRDRYGTCWFSVDRGLAGITSRGDYVTIDDEKKLPSTLFYTLSSDDFGNLIAGTNKGINIIEVDRNGHVLRQNNYSFKEGFGGYETHMRSQFQSGNYCYVGTIEGLYLINTEILRQYPAPPKPVIFFGRENDLGEIQHSRGEKSYYTFKCLLPKSNAIMFSYRIRGVMDKWSDFSFENEVDIPDLPSGEYDLEVRASYDGVTISPTAAYEIAVDIPIWRTKWFIVLIVIILGVVNIAYLEWSKSYLSNNIFDTKDVSVDGKVIPRMILFGLIVYGGMLLIVNMVDRNFVDTTRINFIFSSILFTLFLVSRFYVKQVGNARVINAIFYLAYATIIIESYYLVYVTKLHPFPVFSITMATSVIPFIVSRIRWVIIISLTQVFMAATLLIWLEDPVYNEILFIAAVTISGGIAIMVTYLRNDSLEKLIFVSGVINKGNVMALSFNQRGIITYCSENITNFFAIDFNMVVGKPFSILNPFVATSEMREISLRDEFEDGRIFLIPMYDRANNVVWIEWSCKYFNDSVRVIMGQDVTDKLTLSTNYQSLVENAQDMIYHTDIEANFIFANERCVQQFGYRNEAIIGKNAISLIAPEYREIVHQFYQDQFQNRIHHTYLEFPIKSRDGRIFWVGQNVTMVYEPGSRKRISGFIALARDITEKRANDLLIEQQNKDITASINSAKRIQFNLLPDPQILNRYFDQSFVLFKPKDIVSGDFYWVEEIDDKLIVVLADCTGHGVPGAFMTILGINLLNQIVKERKQCEPDVILNQLHTELELILHKNTGSVMFESMEMLVCVFEQDKLCYASSGVPFVHQKNGELMLYRSTKTTKGNDLTGYEKVCVNFDATESFYLFTDGYQKQFGSIRNKKFGFKRIQELLDKIHVESMPLQKKYFENAWRNWSEGHEQTDDITVLGLRGFRKTGDPDSEGVKRS